MLRGERDSTTAPTTRRPSRTGNATNTRTRVPRLSEARGGRGASETRSRSRLTGSPRSARATSSRSARERPSSSPVEATTTPRKSVTRMPARVIACASCITAMSSRPAATPAGSAGAALSDAAGGRGRTLSSARSSVAARGCQRPSAGSHSDAAGTP